MLRTASVVCNGNMTEDDVIYQALNHDIMLAPGAIPHAFGKQAFGYGLVHFADNTWTRQVEDELGGWGAWLTSQQNDGLLADCPFEQWNPTKLDQVAHEIYPRPLIPNYGDVGTWTRKAPASPPYKEMAEILEREYDWAYVQFALDFDHPFTEMVWDNLRTSALVRLAAGKSLILGIHDRDRANERLAALLMHSFEHPRLYYNYFCAESKVVTDQWNSEWRWAR
jgi:hypothetical protein